MPSAQKQQTTVSRSGATTTTTVTTTSGTAPSASFTQAELGSRSLARSMDRKMQEMNQQKSAAGDSMLDRVLAREKKDISEDKTFGSTANTSDIPERVMRIIRSHEIFDDQIIRMIHIPGANYFSVAHNGEQGKEYSTFSLDEVVEEPEPEYEDISESDILIPETPIVAGINTLGTIGTTIPVVADESIPTTSTITSLAESNIATTPVTVRVPITEVAEMPTFVESEITSPEPKIVIAPFEAPAEIKKEELSLDQLRLAMARDLDTYYSSHYKDHITGTFNQLFGANPGVSGSLFKTISEYNNAKELSFKEFSKTHPSIDNTIDLIRKESLAVAALLNHKKSLLFAKVAQKFGITTSSVIETRNRIIGTAVGSSAPSISEKLGIHTLMNKEPAWKQLIAITLTSPLLQSSANNAPIVINNNAQEITPQILEKKINRAQLYSSLHTIFSKGWNLNQEIVSAVTDPLSAAVEIIAPVESLPEVLPLETVVPTDSEQIVTSVQLVPVQPMTPISFSPEGKQHPEHLFT